MNLFDLVLNSDKIAFEIASKKQPQKIKYSELLLEIKNNRTNINVGEIVGFCEPLSLELILDYLSCIFFGGIPVMLPHSSVKMSDEIYKERISNARRAGISLKSESKFKINDPTIAFGQLSSGTTASQKCFLISHDSIVEHCKSYSKSIFFDQNSVVVSWLPLYHDMGLITSLFLPLLNGASSILIPTFEWIYDYKSLFEAIDFYNATHVWLPNFVFEKLSEIDYVLKNKNCQFINCSEPCRKSSIEKFCKKFKTKNVSCCYAMAETVFAVTQSKLGVLNDFDGIVSSGVCIDGCNIKLNKHSEILVKSKFLHSYVLKQKKLFKTNREDFYNTGDIGSLVNGELFVKGRTKDVAIVAGKNILLSDLDEEINKNCAVHKGRVVSFGIDVNGTEKCVIMYESDKSIDLNIKELIFKKFDISCETMRVPFGNLIKTTSGKFCRYKNRELYLKRINYLKTIILLLQKNNIFTNLFFDTPLMSSGLVDSFLMLNIISETAFFFKKSIDWSLDYRNIDTLEDLWKVFNK